jgi:1-acyl-sn-glycerol-3-phosphate acyltransferase
MYQGSEYRVAVGPAHAPTPLDPLLHPDPRNPPRLYRFLRAVLRFLLPMLFRIRIEGLENIPDPPYIIASNHQRWFDPVFIIPFFPARPMVYSMAKRETVFNRGWKRAIVRRCGVFPISPSHGELDATGLTSVYHVLSRGGVVLIFPEGRYSRGRNLLPLRKGVAHFALQAGVPICPVTLEGLDRLRPEGRVRLSISPPIRPDPPAWWSTSRRVARVVDNLQRSLERAFGRDEGGGRGRFARLLGRWRGRGRTPYGPP